MPNNLLVFLSSLIGVPFCLSCERAAKARGKSGLWAIAYTLFLMFALAAGLVMLMVTIGHRNMLAIHLCVLLALLLGGLLARAIATRGQPLPPKGLPPYLLPTGEYGEDGEPLGMPATLAPPPSDCLEEPCVITLVRDKSFASCLISAEYNLNGEDALILRNGGSGSFVTLRRYNAITVTADGLAVADPHVFTAESGGEVEIHTRPETSIDVLDTDIRKQYWRFTHMADFKYEITERIAVLSQNPNGWERQLNMVSWNDREPKYDIRDWSPDGSKMGKGISMTAEELAILKGVLEEMEI